MQAYDVHPNWADLTPVSDAVDSWAHNGIVVTTAGELIGFHAGLLVAFDRNGHFSRSVRPGLTEGHGITLVREGDEEFLWVSDPGFVFEVGLDQGDEQWEVVFGKGVHVESRPPRVVKMTLDGEILMELPLPQREPDSPPGMMGDYCPCGTAVDEERFGGTGDIWVADGYGASLVHRFDKQGKHRLTLTGEEGNKRFLCPHAVFIDRRGGKTPELYIADRENKCVRSMTSTVATFESSERPFSTAQVALPPWATCSSWPSCTHGSRSSTSRTLSLATWVRVTSLRRAPVGPNVRDGRIS